MIKTLADKGRQTQDIKLNQITVIILSFSVLLFSCTSKGENLEEFKLNYDKAQKLMVDRNYQQAEQQFVIAQKIAEKMKWTDGIVMSKRNMAEINVVARQYDKAETLLNEAKEICQNDLSCSKGQMNSVYDNLVFLYLVHLKGVSKAEKIIDEVILQKEKFPEDKELSSQLNRYANIMEKAGFEVEAEKLKNRLR